MSTQELAPSFAREETQRKRSAKAAARRARILSFTVPTGFFVLGILAWEIINRVLDVNSQILPKPSEVLVRLWTDWEFLVPHTVITLEEAVYGFLLGALVGFIIGVLVAANRYIEMALYPLLITSQAVPKLAIAPMLVIWFGYGIFPKVVITALIVFFPVAVTTAEGMKSVDRSLLDLLKTVNASQWQQFRKVRAPNAVPHIMSGLIIGVTLCVVGAAVGEWVGAQQGLGYLIIAANGQLDTVLAFAAILLLVIMGVVLFGLLSLAQKLLNRGR